jgi:hypothetical protein
MNFGLEEAVRWPWCGVLIGVAIRASIFLLDSGLILPYSIVELFDRLRQRFRTNAVVKLRNETRAPDSVPALVAFLNRAKKESENSLHSRGAEYSGN